MKSIFNAVKIFVTAIFLCGIIFICNTAAAEDSDEMLESEITEEEALEIFRETVMQTAKQDNRVFHQDISFAMPKLNGKLEFFGATGINKLNIAGNFQCVRLSQMVKKNALKVHFM